MSGTGSLAPARAASPAPGEIGAPAEALLGRSPGWRRVRAGAFDLWVKGWPEGRADDALLQALRALGDPPSAEALARWLASVHGHFALVARGPGWALAAVDRIRSIPLIWAVEGSAALISQEAGALARRLGLGPADALPDAVLALALSGFTIGDATLYRGVRQIGPGGFALFRAGASAPELGRYHRFAPFRPEPANDADLERRLADLTLAGLEKLIREAAGRPIAIPLSAGRDSRLIASGLAHLGHRDVLCFAYGLAGNHEAETSRRVAARLGLRWRFVPYSPARMRRVFASDDYARYVASADSLTGIHFPQDYPALRALGAEGYLPGDALVVNGQSGDFITGNHIPAALGRARPELGRAARRAGILDALIAKHYKQWAFLATPENLARIRAMLDREIDAIGGLPADAAGDHGVYEWCEFQDRQSKYVVNGQRLYEYLGHDWRLPLWDDAWLDFWQAAPLEAKAGQRLFARMLEARNWGGVWRDLPVNAKTVRPRWLVPIRLAAKALHAPVGRARWHAFERRFFGYWMANLCTDAVVPYARAAFERRGPRSGLAFHIEAYLAAKGLGLDDAGLGRG